MKKGKHAGIVPLLDTYLSAPFPCLKFEFVPGFDLSGLIRRWHHGAKPEWQTVQRWFRQLVGVIAFAHDNDPPIVHGDLKPANIFVHKQTDGKHRLRVLDFGIGGLAGLQASVETQLVQSSQSVLLTQAARGAYTPLYASPQQKMRRRGQACDPRDDIHALGIIWYQMLTGDLKMVSLPSDWQEELTGVDLPERYVKLLGRCIAAKEERRPLHAGALLNEILKDKTEIQETDTPPPVARRAPTPPPLPKLAADPATQYAQWKKEIDETKAQSQRAANVYDYARAVALLENVPGKHRDEELLQEWTAKRDRLALVLAEVETNWRDMAEDELLERLEEVLQVNPDHARAKTWIGQCGTSAQRRVKKLRRGKIGDIITNPLGMKLAWVPPGQSFLGGGGGKPGTIPFTLLNGLWCGIYPVTQAEWQAVMGDNPSQFKNNPAYPVESVNCGRVDEFLCKLNAKVADDGLTYRLPTELEWEYICRGGPITQDQSSYHYYFARSKTDLRPNPTNGLSASQANFGNQLKRPSDVGTYLPNPLGVYDLHGNVWEWTATSEGAVQVLRGGCWSWRAAAAGCTASSRFRDEPDDSGHYVGFRLLAVPSSKG